MNNVRFEAQGIILMLYLLSISFSPTYEIYCHLKEARRQLHKNAASNLEQVLAATPHKTPTVWPPASYHENYSS